MSELIINDTAIPSMATYWTHSDSVLGRGIQFCRGGFKAVRDDSFPNHSGSFTRDNGVLFGTEEIPSGLKEDSLKQYMLPNNRIVCVYYWNGWRDEEKCQAAQKYLSEVRSEKGPASEYNYAALLSKLPLVGNAFNFTWNSERKICSQMVAYTHMKFGCNWLTTDHLAPDELHDRFLWASKNISNPYQSVSCILKYYK